MHKGSQIVFAPEGPRGRGAYPGVEPQGVDPRVSRGGSMYTWVQWVQGNDQDPQSRSKGGSRCGSRCACRGGSRVGPGLGPGLGPGVDPWVDPGVIQGVDPRVDSGVIQGVDPRVDSGVDTGSRSRDGPRGGARGGSRHGSGGGSGGLDAAGPRAHSRSMTFTVTPLAGPRSPFFVISMGTCVSSQRAIMKRFSTLISAILASMMAKRMPMHLRCPPPKAR